MTNTLSFYLPEADQDRSSRVKQTMIWYWCPQCRTQAWIAGLRTEKKDGPIVNYPKCPKCGQWMKFHIELSCEPTNLVSIPQLPDPAPLEFGEEE